jgi:hypothetical protein
MTAIGGTAVRGQPAGLRLDVKPEVAGKRVEQRDVRPYRCAASRAQCGPLGLEALPRRAIESQRHHERPLVVGHVTHRYSVPTQPLHTQPDPSAHGGSKDRRMVGSSAGR